MTDVKLKQLEKELAYYTSLLNKHESDASKNTALKTSAHKFSDSNWKQPYLPANKMVKNSSHLINLSKPLPSPSNMHLNAINRNKLVSNKRTVLYNHSKYVKSQPQASTLISKNIEISDTKTVSKRTVIDHSSLNIGRKVIFNPENKCGKMNFASNECKITKSSDSKDLLNEIEYLTQLINSTENKPKVSIPNTKIVSSIESNVNYHINEKVFMKSGSKGNSLMHQSFNISKSTPVAVAANFCSSLVPTKLNNNYNLSNKNGTQSYPAFPPSKCCNKSKYSLKKVDIQQTRYSKISQPLKVLNNKVEKIQDLNKSSISQSMNKVNSNMLVNKSNPSVYELCLRTESLLTKANPTVDKVALTKKSNIVSGSTYKLVNKKSPRSTRIKSSVALGTKISPVHKGKLSLILNVKSPVSVKLKSPQLPKGTKSRAVYTKINNRHISSPKKKHLKNSFVYHNAPISKAKNVTSKYKVVNKLDSTPSNKNTLKKQISFESKENTLLSDKSGSFEFLDDSAIDNLEQRLLAISTSLTATPKLVAESGLDENTSLSSLISKDRSKFPPKKTHLRKSKVISSKYKVVNKNAGIKSDSKVCVKKTKYKVVNKSGSTPLRLSWKKRNSIVLKTSAKKLPVNMTPTLNGRSVLVKRLYKSKNTIINKNDSPVNNSAKLIKSKYLALHKRKLPHLQTHASYQQGPFRLQRFKGHFKSNRFHTKLNRHEKYGALLYSNGNRRFSKYNCYIRNERYHKNSSRRCFKQKFNGYGQAPVLVIHGTRYSLSSSGKTLRKLPSKSQTRTIKTPTRVLIGGKPYVRTSENVMKVVSPVSVNLASRVLHRSINRVLIASTKRNLTKVNTYCMFYNRFGRCNRGVKCPYIHDPSKIAVCTRFLRGTCKVEGCNFSHEVAPGKMAICSFFLVDACEKKDCPYRHEQLSPNAVLCKAFVQGYCPNGKECKKAHILICPKFILGECEKGSSCAFPHPPQKAKKIVQKDPVNESELKKEDDILLEKVARYFQPLCQMSPCQSIPQENDTIKFFVPKQKKLEEQPAFIPLSGSID